MTHPCKLIFRKRKKLKIAKEKRKKYCSEPATTTSPYTIELQFFIKYTHLHHPGFESRDPSPEIDL
jgi:hypothetical protein